MPTEKQVDASRRVQSFVDIGYRRGKTPEAQNGLSQARF